MKTRLLVRAKHENTTITSMACDFLCELLYCHLCFFIFQVLWCCYSKNVISHTFIRSFELCLFHTQAIPQIKFDLAENTKKRLSFC